MKKIDGNRKVYDLIQEYPELKPILVDLGFQPLNDDKMLNSLGRIMSLKNGAKQIRLSEEDLMEGLRKEGYEVEL